MNFRRPSRWWYRMVALAGAEAAIVVSMVSLHAGTATADSYVPVTGAGSTWSANAIDTWVADVKQYGMRINYEATGSSDGRSQFLEGTVDFAASDIPFQSHPEDGSAPELPKAGSYAYIPVTAGGTTFIYNLVINGQRVTNLRLSGQNIAKIFTGQIVNWNDPAIKADNPELALPDKPIIPVVRSDGSGSTFQFTAWMINQYPSIWNDYCQRSGRAPSCGPTSFYPTVPGMIAQNGDLGVTGYVTQGFAQGAIGYVEYSYALNSRFPVAKMLNTAGYYTEPTPDNVAVSLLQAQVDTTDVNDPSLYLTQQLNQVYVDADPRVYPLSSYSYMIIPTAVQGDFNESKGKTLAAFSYYAMCQGQQEMGSIGYSPMPVNLVQDTFSQIAKIPGAVTQSINIQSCNNPTFSSSGTNLLATEDPMPPACDKQGPYQCATGTAGDPSPTAVTGPVIAIVGSSGGTGGASSSGGALPSSGSGSSTSGSRSSGSSAGGRSGTNSGKSSTSSGSAGSSQVALGASNGTSSSIGASGSPASGATSSAGTAAAAAAAATQCGDTGVCGSASSSTSSSQSDQGSSGGQPAQLAAQDNAYTLPPSGGGTETLLGLLGFLLLALMLLPGILGRYIRLEKQ